MEYKHKINYKMAKLHNGKLIQTEILTIINEIKR